jgi:hypothetical protein
MSDPKRLATASDSGFERELLRAGRIVAPPGSKERALMAASSALGTSAAVVGGTAAGKGTALGMAKAGSIASSKSVAIVVLTGIGVSTGAVVFHEVHDVRPRHVEVSRAPARPPATPLRARAKVTAPRDDGWTPAPVDPLTIAPTPTDVVAAPSASVQVPTELVMDGGERAASTVPEEMAMLERARGALSAGELARCLSILDRYSERFPRGALAPEGTMLRIEALMNANDRSAARRLADAYLASDPDSPYAARVRSLLETPNP